MSSKTPEKIGRSVTSLEDDLRKLDNLVSRHEELRQKIYQLISQTIERFEDVPVERLRKIRPLIEDVQEKRDDLIDHASKFEEFSDRLKSLKRSLDVLRRYYDDEYLVSVENRRNRDR